MGQADLPEDVNQRWRQTLWNRFLHVRQAKAGSVWVVLSTTK